MNRGKWVNDNPSAWVYRYDMVRKFLEAMDTLVICGESYRSLCKFVHMGQDSFQLLIERMRIALTERKLEKTLMLRHIPLMIKIIGIYDYYQDHGVLPDDDPGNSFNAKRDVSYNIGKDG